MIRICIVLLTTLSVSLARPGNLGGGGGDLGGSFGGSASGGLQLDSYAAPLPSNGGGSYPSGGPAPVYGPPQQAPVVHKHVYVHVPPPEPSYPSRRPVQPPPPPQKHYKIVFIKAPTAPTPTVPEIALPPQVEQKTLIYVLVKKPEEAPEINIPTPAPTQPSKPEVYFIRYKTQKQEGYAPSGVPQSEYGAPSSGSGDFGGAASAGASVGGGAPSSSYGAPSAPSSSYGAPSGGKGY